MTFSYRGTSSSTPPSPAGSLTVTNRRQGNGQHAARLRYSRPTSLLSRIHGDRRPRVAGRAMPVDQRRPRRRPTWACRARRARSKSSSNMSSSSRFSAASPPSSPTWSNCRAIAASQPAKCASSTVIDIQQRGRLAHAFLVADAFDQCGYPAGSSAPSGSRLRRPQGPSNASTDRGPTTCRRRVRRASAAPPGWRRCRATRSRTSSDPSCGSRPGIPAPRATCSCNVLASRGSSPPCATMAIAQTSGRTGSRRRRSSRATRATAPASDRRERATSTSSQTVWPWSSSLERISSRTSRAYSSASSGSSARSLQEWLMKMRPPTGLGDHYHARGRALGIQERDAAQVRSRTPPGRTRARPRRRGAGSPPCGSRAARPRSAMYSCGMPLRSQRLDDHLGLRRRDDLVLEALEDDHRRADLVGVVDRRALAPQIGRLRPRADEPVVVAGLELVRVVDEAR